MIFSQKSEALGKITVPAPLHCQLSDSLSWENIILLALLRTVALNEELLPCQLHDSLFWENTILLRTVALLPCQLKALVRITVPALSVTILG
jgi:hypothetical protein